MPWSLGIRGSPRPNQGSRRATNQSGEPLRPERTNTAHLPALTASVCIGIRRPMARQSPCPARSNNPQALDKHTDLRTRNTARLEEVCSTSPLCSLSTALGRPVSPINEVGGKASVIVVADRAHTCSPPSTFWIHAGTYVRSEDLRGTPFPRVRCPILARTGRASRAAGPSLNATHHRWQIRMPCRSCVCLSTRP